MHLSLLSKILRHTNLCAKNLNLTEAKCSWMKIICSLNNVLHSPSVLPSRKTLLILKCFRAFNGFSPLNGKDYFKSNPLLVILTFGQFNTPGIDLGFSGAFWFSN